MTAIPNFLLKPWLYLIIVIIGTLLKFYRLDSKLFSLDEISSVLYTSGIKDKDILQSIPVNQIKSYSYYDSLLHPSTRSFSLKNEVTSILSDTHLTPAHYVFLSAWYRLAGDDNIDYRLFSVFIFIISLPFLFLLAKTLFNTNLAGWIAMSLYTVSPIIHLEATKTRYYMLWVFLFILSNYMFLLAIKRNKARWWVGYSTVSILALYTSVASGTFIFGHLVYIFLIKKERRLQFASSLLFIVLAYLPWMYFLYTVREVIESGLAWHKLFHTSFFSLDLLLLQLSGFVRSFVLLTDYYVYLSWFIGNSLPGIYSALLFDLVVLAFIAYSIFHLLTKTSKEISWLLILIILPLFLVFYLSDIIRGAFTSLNWKYQVVNILGVSLIVSNLLQVKIAKGKLVYAGIYGGLVVLGIVSILKIGNNKCWFSHPGCPGQVEEAQLVSHVAHPLIITDFSPWGITPFFEMLNESKAKKADIMYCKGIIPNLKDKIEGKNYSEIYVLHASDTLAQRVKLQFGESMLAYRKEVSMSAAQIWRIKL